MVAQIGTGEYVVNVSELPGAYHSMGRGSSARLYEIANPAQSFAKVSSGAVVLQLTSDE